MASRMAADLAALMSDAGTWTSWVVGAVLLVVALVLGSAIGSRAGIIAVDDWVPEKFAISLGIGLLSIVAGYATVVSRGATALTPVALFLIATFALGGGAIRPVRPSGAWVRMTTLGAACIGLMVLVYGMTTAPSARDGVQPIEFMDEAYYAVLAAQVHETGLESVYEPAGFGRLPGTPERSWYHWGEAWLAAVALEVPGMTAVHALHHTALPLLVLASSALSGALTARLAGRSGRREAYFLGAFGMLALAPVPLVAGDHFDWWARPIGFTITQYGLAFVVATLGMVMATTWPLQRTSALLCLAAAISGAMVASHILVAAAAAAGLVGAAAAYIASSERSDVRSWLRRVPAPAAAMVVGAGATFGWGWVSGYGVGGSSQVEGVTPFDIAWQRAVVLVVLGGGVLIAGVAGAFGIRRARRAVWSLAAGSLVAVTVGALVWGVRLADFNAFHTFYGPISVLLTPIASAGVVAAIMIARRAQRTRVASILLAGLLVQGAIGAVATVQRLYEFGPGHYDPMPTAALSYIRDLPAEAKVGYACAQVEEVAVWDARLISVTAHTGRKVVPLCFQADVFGVQLGVPPDPTVPSPFFALAPQRSVWPSSSASPTTEQITAFMDSWGIAYILADSKHANTLDPDAEPVFRSGPVTIYERR
jgi:hypothetical protein